LTIGFADLDILNLQVIGYVGNKIYLDQVEKMLCYRSFNLYTLLQNRIVFHNVYYREIQFSEKYFAKSKIINSNTTRFKLKKLISGCMYAHAPKSPKDQGQDLFFAAPLSCYRGGGGVLPETSGGQCAARFKILSSFLI